MQRINYKQQYDPRSLGLLVKLPAEIIGMIFSEFEDVEDIVYLACTNTRLMILGEKHLREFMYCPSWEGDRIICVGDYAVNDDLPEAVISQEYLNSISGRCKEGEEEREEADLTFMTTTAYCPGEDWLGYYERSLRKVSRGMMYRRISGRMVSKLSGTSQKS